MALNQIIPNYDQFLPELAFDPEWGRRASFEIGFSGKVIRFVSRR